MLAGLPRLSPLAGLALAQAGSGWLNPNCAAQLPRPSRWSTTRALQAQLLPRLSVGGWPAGGLHTQRGAAQKQAARSGLVDANGLPPGAAHKHPDGEVDHGEEEAPLVPLGLRCSGGGNAVYQAQAVARQQVQHGAEEAPLVLFGLRCRGRRGLGSAGLAGAVHLPEWRGNSKCSRP